MAKFKVEKETKSMATAEFGGTDKSTRDSLKRECSVTDEENQNLRRMKS